MKKLSWGIALFSFLAGMTLLVGCFSSSDGSNPLAPTAATVAPAAANAVVNFNIMVSTEGSAAAIRAEASGTAPQVRFTLQSIDPTSSTPVATYTQTVDVVGGSASATFNVPARSTIARIRILGGNIRGFHDFHGGSDLVAGGNIMTVCPVGSGFKQDLIARMMAQTIEQPTVLRAAPQNLAARVQMCINTIVSDAAQATSGTSTPSTTLPVFNAQNFAEAFNTFVAQIQPQGLTRFTTDNTGNLRLASGTAGTLSLTATDVFNGVNLVGGVNPANMRLGPVFRPGIGGLGCVGYDDANGQLSCVVQIDPANPANRFSMQLPGRVFCVEFLIDGSLLIGGYHRGSNAPVLCRWTGTANAAFDLAAPTTDVPTPPAGISWIRHFGALLGTTQMPSRVESIDYNPEMNEIIAVIRHGNDVQIFRIDPMTGQNLAGFAGPAIPIFTPPPAVRIATPTGAVSVTAGGNLAVQVMAIPGGPNSTVANVALWEGATRLPINGTPGANNTWTFNWTAIPAGFYILTARANDNEGVVGVSDAIQVVALPQGMTAPVVNIASPTPGTAFTEPANINIVAEATSTDSITRIEFYNGPELLGSRSQAPWVFNWQNVGAGFYMLTARVYTSRGAIDMSQPVGIQVNPAMPTYSVPPQVRITTPTMNQAFPTAPADITITAEAVTGEVMPPMTTWTPANRKSGTFAYTPMGAPTTSRIRRIEFFYQTPPEMERLGMTTVPGMTMPSGGTPTDTNTGTMTGPNTGYYTGGDPAMQSPINVTMPPTMFVDPGMKLIGVASAPPYTVTWRQAPQGLYVITAVVHDEYGMAMPVDGVMVRVGNVSVPPVVDIVAPDAGSTITAGGQITLVASASTMNANGSITGVSFVLDDGRQLGNATLNNGQWTWTGTLPNDLYIGPHTIGAIAVDNNNMRMVSPPLFVMMMPTGTYTNTGVMTDTGTIYGTGTGYGTGYATGGGTGTNTGVTTLIGTSTGTGYGTGMPTGTMTGTGYGTGMPTGTMTGTGYGTGMPTGTMTGTGTTVGHNPGVYFESPTTGGAVLRNAPLGVTVNVSAVANANFVQIFAVDANGNDVMPPLGPPNGFTVMNGRAVGTITFPTTWTPGPVSIRALAHSVSGGGPLGYSQPVVLDVQ